MPADRRVPGQRRMRDGNPALARQAGLVAEAGRGRRAAVVVPEPDVGAAAVPDQVGGTVAERPVADDGVELRVAAAGERVRAEHDDAASPVAHAAATNLRMLPPVGK